MLIRIHTRLVRWSWTGEDFEVEVCYIFDPVVCRLTSNYFIISIVKV